MLQTATSPLLARQRLPWRLAFAALFGLATSLVAAEEVRVNFPADLPDADPADGRCDVDTVQPGDQCSLRAAAEQVGALPAGEHRILIDTLSANPRLRVDKGTIRLPGGTTLIGDTEHLVALFASLPAGKDLFRIGGDGEITLHGLDIRLSEASGAAIRIDQPQQAVHLADVRIVAGGAGAAALRVGSGLVDCHRCRLVDGATTAVEVSGGELRLVDSLVADNHSDDAGGGLRLSDGQVWLLRTEVSRNRSQGDGGGIQQSGGRLRLINSLLRGNLAGRGGGGMAVTGGVTELQNSSVTGNVANASADLNPPHDHAGGGVLTANSGQVRLRNSLISANRALGRPEGHECQGSSLVSEAANLIGNDAGCLPQASATTAPLRSSAALTSSLRKLPWGGVRFFEQPTGSHPAVNAGSGHCLADVDLNKGTADQPLQRDLRNQPRPSVDAIARCDLGAFQSDCSDGCGDYPLTDDGADTGSNAATAPVPDAFTQTPRDARVVQP